MEENKTTFENESEAVTENIGRLNQSVEQLAESEAEDCDLKPEEVGGWIREIGRAIFAIIKP